MLPLLSIPLWCFVALALVLTVKRWHEPEEHPSYRMPPYWIWGDSSWRGFRRTRVPVLVLGFCLLAASLFPGLTIPVGFAVLLVLMPLVASVFLFNWPKGIVPPPFRTEKGVVANYFAKPS